MTQHRIVVGRKKGMPDEPAKPYEATDTLVSVQKARIIDLLSEGPVEGLVNGAKSVFFDDVPLQNEDGSYNFQGVNLEFRAGNQEQDPLPSFPFAEREVEVGIRLKGGEEASRIVYDENVDFVVFRISLPALSFRDDKGNVVGTKVQLEFFSQDAGGTKTQLGQLTLDGKASSRYDREVSFRLPGTAPWKISAKRITPDDSTSDHAYRNETYWTSYVERIDAKLSFPFSSVIGVTVDASAFSNVPARRYNFRGRRVLVPDNRRADLERGQSWDGVNTPQYSGFWQGTFKTQEEWTNNPAWCMFDLFNNRRYGLGKWVNPSLIPGEAGASALYSMFVDKWTTYEIGKYCDGLVPDGRGGLEKRFAFNAYFQNDAEAYQMIGQIASVFRGMAFWANAQMLLSNDRPQDPVYLFTNANVVDGTFVYSGSDRRSRITACFVSYNDPNDGYRRAVEYVEDHAGIARFGYNALELNAFGCTSIGQARRAGLWAIYSSVYETAQITFKGGMVAATLLPGQVISVQDEHRNGYRWGGFVREVGNDLLPNSQIARPYVIVDAPVRLHADKSYQFAFTSEPDIYSTDGGYGETVQLNAEAGGEQAVARNGDTTVRTTRVTVTADGDYTKLYFVDGAPGGKVPAVGGMWTLSEPTTAVQQLYRVMAVAEEGEGVYGVAAIEYDANKYTSIEQDFRIPDEQNAPTVRSFMPSPVEEVTHSEQLYLESLIVKSSLTVSWVGNIDSYSFRVRYRYDGIVENDNGTTSPGGRGNWLTLPPVNESTLTLLDMSEGYYVFEITSINALGTMSRAPVEYSLQVLGKSAPPTPVDSTTIKATLQTGGVLIEWGAIADVDRNNYVVKATPLDPGEFYGKEELVDDTLATSALYSSARGKGSRFLITIQSFDTGGRGSPFLASKEVSFSPPAIVENFVAYQNLGYLDFHWSQAARAVNYKLRAGDTWETGEFIGETSSPQLSVEWGRTGTKRFWVRAYDALDNPSALPTSDSVDVAKPPARNVVLDFDEHPTFTGWKFNMDVIGVQLSLLASRTYGEYVHEHTITDTHEVIVTIDNEVEAVFESGLTWADLTYPWNDPRAQQSWVKVGEVSQIETQHFAAVDEELSPDVAGLWKLDAAPGLIDEVASVAPNVGYTVSGYADGKFGQGMLVDNATAISWPLPLGEEWTTYFTYLFDDSAAGRRLFEFGGGDSMQLWYDNQRLTFILQASDAQRIELARRVAFDGSVEQIQTVMRTIGFPYQQFVTFSTTAEDEITKWLGTVTAQATVDRNGDSVLGQQWQEYATIDFWPECQQFLQLLQAAAPSLQARTGAAYQAFDSYCSLALVEAGLTFSLAGGDMVFFGVSQFLDTRVVLGQTVTRKKRSLFIRKHGDPAYLYGEIDVEPLDFDTLTLR